MTPEERLQEIANRVVGVKLKQVAPELIFDYGQFDGFIRDKYVTVRANPDARHVLEVAGLNSEELSVMLTTLRNLKG